MFEVNFHDDRYPEYSAGISCSLPPFSWSLSRRRAPL
jgi:hypothetical protein